MHTCLKVLPNYTIPHWSAQYSCYNHQITNVTTYSQASLYFVQLFVDQTAKKCPGYHYTWQHKLTDVIYLSFNQQRQLLQYQTADGPVCTHCLSWHPCCEELSPSGYTLPLDGSVSAPTTYAHSFWDRQ